MLAKNKEHNARSKGDRRLCFERVMRRLAKQAVPSQFSDSFYHCGAAILALIIQFDMVLCFSSFIKTDFAEYIQKQTGSPRSAAIFAVYAG